MFKAETLEHFGFVDVLYFSLMLIFFLFLHISKLSGGEGQSFCGRVITVKWGDYTRRIGIDGTSEAIKEAIRAAFRLRSKRLFWLEDEYQIIRSLDRDMPLGNYTLHLDEGILSLFLFSGSHSVL